MSAASASVERRPWAISAFGWFARRFRPYLGWGAFLGALILVLLPAAALRSVGWVNIGRSCVVPEWAVVIGMIVTWPLLARWGRWTGSMQRGGRILVGIGLFLLWLLSYKRI